VGMESKHAQPYPTLSGGEQQKVQLARVLAQIWPYDGPPEPRYLFLDEPTSSLDVHYQIHLLDLARALLRHHCTVVAVLHDLNTAFHYGDHFLLLENGRVALQTDDAAAVPADLLERVFRVRAHRVLDPENGERLWRFSL
jgi:iron complex transport system ATP-binding protein